MTSLNRSDDNDLLTALRHPLRRRILREMSEDRTISPRELAVVLGQPLSNVSYHVRVLAECGAVTLVSAKPTRGSMQHFYRRAVDAPWALQVIEMEDAEDEAPGENEEGPQP